MSKLTEAETKEIEQLAMEYVSITRPSSFPNGRQEGYIAGATAMAEKKNIEAESRERLLEEYSSALLALRKKNDVNLAQLEAAQEAIKIKDKAIEILKDVSDKVIESKEAELSRVKEVAEKMAAGIKKLKPILSGESSAEQALTEFANLMNKEK